MKLALKLCISDPMDYAKGDYNWCFSVYAADYPDDCIPDKWVNLGTFEVEVDVDEAEVNGLILLAMDEARRKLIEKHAKELAIMDRQRAEFLALAAPAETPMTTTVEGGGTG